MCMIVDGKKLKALIELKATEKGVKSSKIRTYICLTLGITKQTLSHYEKGHFYPDLDKLFWFKKLFKLDNIEQFFKKGAKYEETKKN